MHILMKGVPILKNHVGLLKEIVNVKCFTKCLALSQK